MSREPVLDRRTLNRTLLLRQLALLADADERDVRIAAAGRTTLE